MHDVIIGIVTYNSREHIDQCLQSIQQQTYPQIKVLIFDNNSGDDTVNWLITHWPIYSIIRSDKNLGFGNAHNRIIAQTQSTYYMPLNPDLIMAPDYVATMVETVEQSDNIGWVSGKLYILGDDDEDIVYTAGHAVFKDGFAVNIGFNHPDQDAYCQERQVFGANGAAPLYKRKMLKELQIYPEEVFDSEIFLYGEDVDLDWRARLLGWDCMFTPDALAYHVHGASGGASFPEIRYMITANRYYSIFKHAFLFDLLTYNLPTFILHSLYMLVSEPQRGWKTITVTLSRIARIKYSRQWIVNRRKMSRKTLVGWFQWSKDQQAGQAYHYLARFWRGRMRRGSQTPRA